MKTPPVNQLPEAFYIKAVVNFRAKRAATCGSLQARSASKKKVSAANFLSTRPKAVYKKKRAAPFSSIRPKAVYEKMSAASFRLLVVEYFDVPVFNHQVREFTLEPGSLHNVVVDPMVVAAAGLTHQHSVPFEIVLL